jgi:hypothetical protein
LPKALEPKPDLPSLVNGLPPPPAKYKPAPTKAALPKGLLTTFLRGLVIFLQAYLEKTLV